MLVTVTQGLKVGKRFNWRCLALPWRHTSDSMTKSLEEPRRPCVPHSWMGLAGQQSCFLPVIEQRGLASSQLQSPRIDTLAGNAVWWTPVAHSAIFSISHASTANNAKKKKKTITLGFPLTFRLYKGELFLQLNGRAWWSPCSEWNHVLVRL